MIKETKENLKKYKDMLTNIGVKNIDKAVDDFFGEVGYVGRLLFHYWHYQEMKRKLEGEKKHE